MIEFSPISSSGTASTFNIKAMIEAYQLLEACLRYTADEGLSSDEAATVTRYLTSVYLRLGSVSDMPHRALYVAQVILELSRLRKWLICQLDTKITGAALSEQRMRPAWLHGAPTEDMPPRGGGGQG